jgi:hypothetical protein
VKWSKPGSSATAPYPDWKTHGAPEPKPKGFGAAGAGPAAKVVSAPSRRQLALRARGVRAAPWLACNLDISDPP